MRYPVLLFDLFRTVLMFTPDAPTGQVREPGWRPAMEKLRARAVPLLGPVAFDRFVDALYDASVAIAAARAPEHREVPIEERYRRALARLDGDAALPPDTAARLADLQLEVQAANTELPPGHLPLLRTLARAHRLAVVSNFDHSATVHQLLARHGLDRVFHTAVISIDYGRRKPHPAIFQEALRRVDAAPTVALFVGDSLSDDIAGARAAGIDGAWINWDGRALPAGGPAPTFVLHTLTELPAVLQ